MPALEERSPDAPRVDFAGVQETQRCSSGSSQQLRLPRTKPFVSVTTLCVHLDTFPNMGMRCGAWPESFAF